MEVLFVDYSLLGKRIREERLKLNLTQEHLSEDIGISTAYLGQIERGERSVTLDKLVSLANRLGVTVDYLLSDSVAFENNIEYKLWCQLMNGRTEEQKTLAVTMVKLMFSYIDQNA